MMYAYCYEINELNVSFYPGTKLSSETDLKYPGEVLSGGSSPHP